MVVGGNLNSPINLFILFAKALIEQRFPSDPFLRRTVGNENVARHVANDGFILHPCELGCGLFQIRGQITRSLITDTWNHARYFLDVDRLLLIRLYPSFLAALRVFFRSRSDIALELLDAF
jgi:hypothetical protein